VELEGLAVQAQFKFGNRRPGAESPLMFEIADKHLRDCLSKYIPTLISGTLGCVEIGNLLDS